MTSSSIVEIHAFAKPGNFLPTSAHYYCENFLTLQSFDQFKSVFALLTKDEFSRIHGKLFNIIWLVSFVIVVKRQLIMNENNFC